LLKRPEQQGVAQRTSRNTYVICDLGAKAWPRHAHANEHPTPGTTVEEPDAAPHV
jgi:hypothetical protein